MKNEGLSIHFQHDLLVEYCFDYKDRVADIESDKPAHEKEIRLRLFKLLSDEAIKSLPAFLIKADEEWQNVYVDWYKVYVDWHKVYEAGQYVARSDADVARRRKADVSRKEADSARRKADVVRREAYADWPQEASDAWHKKFCGCKEWNGKEIVFK